jgi:N-acetylneuraminic acid mutarotase
MPTARSGLATCAVNGRIYAIGGRISENPRIVTSIVEVYDPVTDTWTEDVDMVVPRDLLSASAVNGKIYAIGGWNPSMAPRTLSTVEEYTPEGLSSQQLVSPEDKLPTTWGEIK